MEGLPCLINRAYDSGFLSGILVSKLCAPITHLLLVDDSLVFLQTITKEFGALKSHLDKVLISLSL